MRMYPRALRGPERVRLHLGRRCHDRTCSSARPVLESLECRWLLSTVDATQPTAAEQYMLELINRARANPAAEGQRLVAMAQSNPVIAAATRGENLGQFLQVISSYPSEPPLAFNPRLIAAALDHDYAMLSANMQFHAAADYLNNPQTATAADGQVYYATGPTGWSTGENVFAYSGNVPAGSSDQAYVDYFEAAFFLDWGNPDFGHLKNLLAPGPAEAAPGTSGYGEIGIGLLTGVTPSTPPGSNNAIAANRGLNVGPDIITEEFGGRTGNAFLTGVVFVDTTNTQFYAPGEGLGSVTFQAVGQDGEGTFQTQTWNSGGYSLSLPPGTYTVTASGPGLSAPQSTTITIGKDNVGWSLPIPAPPGTAPTSGSPGGSSSSSSSSTLGVSLLALPPGTQGQSHGHAKHPKAHVARKVSHHAATPHGPLPLARTTHAPTAHRVPSGGLKPSPVNPRGKQIWVALIPQ